MQISESTFNLLVFLIILGTAGGVLMAWAVFHFFYDTEAPNPHSFSAEQAVYMREVRLRSLRSLAAMMGRKDVMRDLYGRLPSDRDY